MTPSQLDAAIRAKRLSRIVVKVGDTHHWTTVVEAREDDGWLFVAGAPIPHHGEPWINQPVSAWLWVPGDGRISETVVLDPATLGEGQSLLVAIGLRLHADNGTTSIQ